MAFTEDLTAFFVDFGVTANAGAADFLVIFDAAYIAALGAAAESVGPQCLAMAADVPGVAQGAAITVAGTQYTVTEPQPDGTGLVLLQPRLAN